MGITPTVSVGSIDLHSMAQLYLGGPRDKFTQFVEVKSTRKIVKVPSMKPYNKLVDNIQGSTLNRIMIAILKGIQIAFRKGKRPYSRVVLQKTNEFTIGQLLQFHMVEMMYLGYLLGVNPFDQPNVEAYKKETRQILERG